MSQPDYPEKHKNGSCNDGQCDLCDDSLPEHDCKAYAAPDGSSGGCEVCAEYWGDKADDLDELRADDERMERKEGKG